MGTPNLVLQRPTSAHVRFVTRWSWFVSTMKDCVLICLVSFAFLQTCFSLQYIPEQQIDILEPLLQQNIEDEMLPAHQSEDFTLNKRSPFMQRHAFINSKRSPFMQRQSFMEGKRSPFAQRLNFMGY